MIEFRAFSKRFDAHVAVEDLSCQIGRGEAVALLGPNGSGKTTTIKAAAGLIRPTSGQVLIGDPAMPASLPSTRRLTSFLPQRVAFPDALTGREVVEFYRTLRGVHETRTDKVMRFAALNGAAARVVGTYSGGMVQRLGLAVAMLPEAPIMLLDEPTAALDPDGLCAFYGILDAHRQTGATVLFSSHQMGDVERLADRYIVLVAGRLVADLTRQELVQRLADRGVMRVRLASRVEGLLERVRTLAPSALWANDELIVPGPATARPSVLDTIRGGGGDIRGLTADEGRLDALYRELVGGQS
jgi:Cu-processing system ATP-binding protein